MLTDRILGDVRQALARIGDVFADFGDDKSGCIAHGVEVGAERFFVKHVVGVRGVAAQARAIAVHAAVRHPTLVPLVHAMKGDRGPVLAYPQIDGVRLRGIGMTARLPLSEVF